MKTRRNTKSKAFTLAETLIALVIIGVIAAITVPTLIQNTQKQEYVSALKKAYSTLSQVTQQIIAEEGSPKASDSGWASSAENVYNLFKKHMNNAKECGTESGCYTPKGFTTISGDKEGNIRDSESYQKLVFSDGMIMGISKDWIWNNCESDWYKSSHTCAVMYVDINGAKKPNTIGKDVFGFVIKEQGLYPAGCDSEACLDGGAGWGCACKVLREGAMNY